jgi:hypothetical protein
MTITEWLLTPNANYTTGLALLAQNNGAPTQIAKLAKETPQNRKLLETELRKALKNQSRATVVSMQTVYHTNAITAVAKKKRASGGCCN